MHTGLSYTFECYRWCESASVHNASDPLYKFLAWDPVSNPYNTTCIDYGYSTTGSPLSISKSLVLSLSTRFPTGLRTIRFLLTTPQALTSTTYEFVINCYLIHLIFYSRKANYCDVLIILALQAK